MYPTFTTNPTYTIGRLSHKKVSLLKGESRLTRPEIPPPKGSSRASAEQ